MNDAEHRKKPRPSRFYQYEPLADATSQIRLFKLLPCENEGEIKCEIATYPLEHLPSYCAVSYECGSPGTEVEVFVNGKVANIRYNLFLFLKKYNDMLQSKSTSATFNLDVLDGSYPTLIWADALSINQASAEEKKTQIPLLGTIFYRARHVYAWLGWSTLLDSRSLFDMIAILAERGSELDTPTWGSDRWKKFRDDDSSKTYSEKRIDFARIQFDEFKDSRVNMKYVDFELAFLRFVNLSFWSRRWPLQECLLGKNVTLVLDDHKLRWSKLMKFWPHVVEGALSPILGDKIADTTLHAMWNWMRVAGNRSQTVDVRFQHISLRSSTSTRYGGRPLLEMSTLLGQFGNTACELPCDHLYSLLNLTSGPSLIEADYECPPLTLFCKIFSDHSNHPVASLRTEYGQIGGLGDARWAVAAVKIAQALGLMNGEGKILANDSTVPQRIRMTVALPQTTVPIYRPEVLSLPLLLSARGGDELAMKLTPDKVATAFRSLLVEDKAKERQLGKPNAVDAKTTFSQLVQGKLGNSIHDLTYSTYWTDILPLQDVRSLKEMRRWEEIFHKGGILTLDDKFLLTEILFSVESSSDDNSSLFWHEKMFACSRERDSRSNENIQDPIRSGFFDSSLTFDSIATSPRQHSHNSESPVPRFREKYRGFRPRTSTQKISSSSSLSLSELSTLPDFTNPESGDEFYHLAPGVGIFARHDGQGNQKMMQWVATKGLKDSNDFWSERLCNVKLDFSLPDFLNLVWNMNELGLA